MVYGKMCVRTEIIVLGVSRIQKYQLRFQHLWHAD